METLKGVHGFNMLSPFGRVVRYEPATKHGFFLFPASNNNPAGWGKPLVDSEGKFQLPGTKGGPDPIKFIAKPPGSVNWAVTGIPGSQLYGNIDWRGPQIDLQAPEKGRLRLSFHGPMSRQFPSPTFNYGSDPKHNNVYRSGFCIAVAPDPVLGAAVRQDSQGAYQLVVICKRGQSDVVYRRPFPTQGVNANEYTDEWRIEKQALYNPTSNPEGWVTLGQQTPTVGGQGSNCVIKAARTPWFFNESGTEAQCVRECDVTLFRGDVDVTHKGFNRFRVTVGNQTVRFQDLSNNPPFVITVNTKRTPQPLYSVLTRYPDSGSPDLIHHWENFNIYQEIKIEGRYVIGVDYRGDSEVLVEAVHDSRRTFEQWFYRGVDSEYDASYLPGNSNDNYANDDDYFGDLYNIPEPQDRYPGDGRLSGWFSNAEDLRLEVDGEEVLPLHRIISGDKDQFFTGQEDDNDPFLYYWWWGRSYPHFLDARNNHVSFQFDYEMEQDQQRFFRYEIEFYNTGEFEYDLKFMERPFPAIAAQDYGLPGVDYGWKNEDVDNVYPLEIDQSDEFLVIDGMMPGEGENPIQFPSDFPDPLEVYTPPPIWGPRVPLHRLLTDEGKAIRAGGHAVDDFGNRVVSMAYLDHANDLKYYNSLNGEAGELEQLLKAGTRFYPIGVS